MKVLNWDLYRRPPMFKSPQGGRRPVRPVRKKLDHEETRQPPSFRPVSPIRPVSRKKFIKDVVAHTHPGIGARRHTYKRIGGETGQIGLTGLKPITTVITS